jgi:hypothetical protein
LSPRDHFLPALRYPGRSTLKRGETRPITPASVTPYLIPATPPPELLAELDAAAGLLEDLTARAAILTLETEEHSCGLRIELVEEDEVRRLTASQLLDLLSGREPR